MSRASDTAALTIGRDVLVERFLAVLEELDGIPLRFLAEELVDVALPMRDLLGIGEERA